MLLFVFSHLGDGQEMGTIEHLENRGPAIFSNIDSLLDGVIV